MEKSHVSHLRRANLKDLQLLRRGLEDHAMNVLDQIPYESILISLIRDRFETPTCANDIVTPSPRSIRVTFLDSNQDSGNLSDFKVSKELDLAAKNKALEIKVACRERFSFHRRAQYEIGPFIPKVDLLSSALACGVSSLSGRAKKIPAKKKGQPAKATQLPQARQIEQVVQEQIPQSRPTTVPAQVVMPPEMGGGEDFNVVKGAMQMFTTFMENQGQRGD
ncbi:hypothetical protein HAX54_020577 [Datura stramonium]|uniref:Uncharacterized protein n=1 Tax=Datura stramonium TaxID=4076 RepID=A0ABS8UTS0_DATST|nr:hypothetical protein [Datura stramonium]